MKKLTAGLITFSLFSASYGIDLTWNSSFYGSYFDYADSVVKDDGYSAGFYGYLGIGLEHSLEGEIDYTKINYLDAGSLNQWDFTLLYTYYGISGTKVRLGGHYISSDDSATDGGVIGYAGVEKTVDYKYDFGIDGAISYYDNYAVEKTYIRKITMGKKSWTFYTNATVNGLTVLQVSPKFGISFPSTAIGDLYFETKGYYIWLSDSVGFGRNFLSVEENIYVDYGDFRFHLYGWIGEQEFAVKNYGFLVYNLSERYKNGFGGSIRYNLSDRSFITAGLQKEYFKEIDNPNTAEVSALYFFGGVNF